MPPDRTKPWNDEDLDFDPVLERLNAEPIPRLNGAKVDPLELWQKVSTTDPSITKPFNRGGGFKGTAIAPLYTIHKATALWGPIGGDWGVEILSEEWREGGPLFGKDDKKTPLGKEIVHVLRVRVRYPGGSVEHYGQTTFVGSNKYGPFTDEEAPKKSLTDAVTKALSWLGFSADVHIGALDDHKYASDDQSRSRDARYEGGVETDEKPLSGPFKITELKDRTRKLHAAIFECTEETELDGLLLDYGLVIDQIKREYKHWWYGKRGDDTDALKDIIDEKRRELTAPDRPKDDWLP